MKQAITLIFALLGFVAKAQTITNEKMNIVYRGVPNPISVSIPNYSCDELIVEVDAGELQQVGDSGCSYDYMAKDGTPNSIIFKVFVKTKKGKEKKLEAKFRVKTIPPPEASIGRKRNAEISHAFLKANLGMIAYLSGFDIEAVYRVTNFNYAIIRNDKVIKNGTNESAKFDDKTKTDFSCLEPKDKVLFYNISCKAPDSRIQTLESFELTIANDI